MNHTATATNNTYTATTQRANSNHKVTTQQPQSSHIELFPTVGLEGSLPFLLICSLHPLSTINIFVIQSYT